MPEDLELPEERETSSRDEQASVYRWYRGQPVPDLTRIPHQQWEATLRPLAPWARQIAARGAGSVGEIHLANRIALDLDLADIDRRRRALDAIAPPPPPHVARSAGKRRNRQVNFRLSGDEYRDLTRAALDYGVSCSTLARMLTVRGVRHALDDV